MKIVEAECPNCGKSLKKELRYYNAAVKENPQYVMYCNARCKNLHTGIVVEIICFTCNKKFNRSSLAARTSTRNFCSSSCAAKTTNKNRILPDKYLTCTMCKTAVSVRYNCSAKKFKCSDCKRLNNKAYSEQKVTFSCKECKAEQLGNRWLQYCVDCLSIVQRRNGCKSAANQRLARRSKNEIYFSELCQKHFITITCNDSLFDGWDADVLIHDYKIAVLWNGPWHYMYCGGRHSLKQVQSRDTIKLKKIAEAGWTAYIIKDHDNHSHGKYSTNFVEEQFNLFLDFIKGIANVHQD